MAAFKWKLCCPWPKSSQQYATAPVKVQIETTIHLIHKSQDAPVPYATMLHSEQKCAHFCSEWSIVIHKSQNAPVPYPTMLHSELFWMEHCGIWNRCILGFVKLVYSMKVVVAKAITGHVLRQLTQQRRLVRQSQAAIKPHHDWQTFVLQRPVSLVLLWSKLSDYSVSNIQGLLTGMLKIPTS